MAPKRAAKKAAPPPPPPPPAESSDETRSGSDESEDEMSIAESPVPAATPAPAPKHTPAPALKGHESESSAEEDDDEEEEEEEEDQPARPASKNQPPPPQKKVDADASGSDDEEEEEEEEEEFTLAVPPSVSKKQPPQLQKEQGSDTSGEEEEEEEEEAPLPKPAPKKDMLALKPPAPAADEAKKTGCVKRIWTTDDELHILEAIAALQKQHGAFPQPEVLLDAVNGKLDNPAYGIKELHSKVKALRHRYLTLAKKGEVPSKEHDRRLLDLSKIVWEGGDKTITPAAVSNNHGQKGFEEMCELYPYLAEEVKKLEAARPGMCKRDFGKMDHNKAHAMNEKIKKQRVLQIRVVMRGGDLVKEVTKTLMDQV